MSHKVAGFQRKLGKLLGVIGKVGGSPYTCLHGCHSKLRVENVHKTTMVGMDIKHMYLEAGLLYTVGVAHRCADESMSVLTITYLVW